MRNQLAAIELRVLVNEFGQLAGSRLGQVYDLQAASGVAGKALVFQFNAGSEGTHRDSPDGASPALAGLHSRLQPTCAFSQWRNCQCFLACLVPSSVFFSLRKPRTSESPSGFCSFLRHRLGNARLASARQLGSERILELVFSSKNGQLRLFVELFSKGNIILADESGIILGCAEQQQWKDRTLRPGFAYMPPPATADFAAMEMAQFQNAVLSSGKDSVVKALAVGVGLSGTYAEELCAAAAVDKAKQPKQLSQPEISRLYSSLQQLLSRKPEPVAVSDANGCIIEAYPFPVAAVAASKTKSFSTFNEAVEAVMLSQMEAASLSLKTASYSRQIREMEIAIERQHAAVQEMEKAANEATAVAEAIYVHYMGVRQILDDYNRLRKTFTPHQLREYFSSNKKVVSIDEKTGTVAVELEGEESSSQ